MHLIEDPAQTFFADVIVPLAQLLEERGQTLLAPGPDPQLQTYFDETPHRRLSPEAMELPADTLAWLSQSLERLWSQDDEVLREIIPQLVALAQTLREQGRAEGAGTVSHFNYVLF